MLSFTCTLWQAARLDKHLKIVDVDGRIMSTELLTGFLSVCTFAVDIHLCLYLKISVTLCQFVMEIKVAGAYSAGLARAQSEEGWHGPGAQLKAVHAHRDCIHTAPDLHSARTCPLDVMVSPF